MKNKIKWLKRPMHFALALLVIAILGIGTTIAFFTDIEAAVNSITFGKIKIETNEEVKGLTKTGIGVTSTGSSEAYVRIRVDVPTVTYRYIDNGEIKIGSAEITLPGTEQPISAEKWLEQQAMSITVRRANPDADKPSKAEWLKKEDGFWYLSVTLEKGDQVPFLSKIEYPGLLKGNSVELPVDLTMDMLTIPIVSEAVQAEAVDIKGKTGADAAFEAFKAVEQGQLN